MAPGLGSTLNIPVTTSQVALAIIHLPWSFKPESDTLLSGPSAFPEPSFYQEESNISVLHYGITDSMDEFEQTPADSE